MNDQQNDQPPSSPDSTQVDSAPLDIEQTGPSDNPIPHQPGDLHLPKGSGDVVEKIPAEPQAPSATFQPTIAPPSMTPGLTQDTPHFGQVAKRSRLPKAIVVGLVAAIGVFIFGGGALAYNYFIILPNTPENVVAKAVGNLISEERTAGDFYADIDVTFKDDTSSVMKGLSLRVDMSADLHEGDNPAAAMRLGVPEVAMRFGDAYSKYDFQIENSDLHYELRLLGDRGYMMFDGLESMRPAIIKGYSAYYKYLDDQYSSLDYYRSYYTQVSDVEIEREVDAMLAQVARYEGTWFDFDTGGQELNLQTDSDVSDILVCLEDSGNSLSQTIVQQYVDNRFLLVDNDNGSVVIEGDDMRHFDITFDHEQFATFVDVAYEAVSSDQEAMSCIKDASPELHAEIEDFDATSLDSIDQDYSFEIWIDEDKNIRQVAFQHNEDGYELDLTFGMQYREPNVIEKPSTSQKFIDVAQGLGQADDTSNVLGDNTTQVLQNTPELTDDLELLEGADAAIKAPEVTWSSLINELSNILAR